MGVERNLSNDATNSAAITRCSKSSSVDIYRPPALRYQNNTNTNGSASTKNDRKNVTNTATISTTTTNTTIAAPTTVSSISCNSSPTHANENHMCNTMTSPDDTSNGNNNSTSNKVLTNTTGAAAAAGSGADTQSTQQQQNALAANASRRERRPDRAVYVPRARRSQTTPPATTQQQQSPTTNTNHVGEQQLPITLDANVLVAASPSSKSDEVSKNNTTKKSKSSSTKERKESRTTTTKKQTQIKTPAVAVEDTAQKNTLVLITRNTNQTANSKDHFNVTCDKEFKNSKNISDCNNQLTVQPPDLEHPICTNIEMANANNKNKKDKFPNMHIEDVIRNERVVPKCDIDEQELQRASKEINRSNRRIMKQTFVSDVLEIPEKIDAIDATQTHRAALPSSRATADTTTDEDEDDEDDWENMFDESGECLDPKILQELTASVGKVKIELPKMDYTAYLTKQSILNDEEFPHVLEVSNFPTEFKNQDLLMVFSQYKESGFDIKWVDDTHALAVFSSSRIAAEVLTMGHPFVVLKPLAEATVESRLKAKKCANSLQPYRARPETCAALARRLVTGALGVRLKTAAAERENEKRVLREAKERKLLAAKQRDEVWES